MEEMRVHLNAHHLTPGVEPPLKSCEVQSLKRPEEKAAKDARGCAGASPDTSADAVPGEACFPLPKVAHPSSILSPIWGIRGSSPDPNWGGRVMTPLCRLKSCPESWSWKRHLAGEAAEGRQVSQEQRDQGRGNQRRGSLGAPP